MRHTLTATWVALATAAGTAQAADTIASKIADDYPRALAAARQRSAPIFIDAWAPW